MALTNAQKCAQRRARLRAKLDALRGVAGVVSGVADGVAGVGMTQSVVSVSVSLGVADGVVSATSASRVSEIREETLSGSKDNLESVSISGSTRDPSDTDTATPGDTIAASISPPSQQLTQLGSTVSERTFYLTEASDLPWEFADEAEAAGFREEEYEPAWERFRDHNIANAKRGTLGTFRRGWFAWMRENRARAKRDAVTGRVEAEDEARRLAIRDREAKLLEERWREAQAVACPPTDVALALAKMWDDEEEPQKRRYLTPEQRLAMIHGAPDDVPVRVLSAQERAAILGELGDEMRKAGGLQ